jgi:outer membrane protein assembly factor BamB
MDYWTEKLTYKAGAAYLGQGFRIKKLYDDHVGTLRAINPKTGKIAWEHKEKFPLWAGTLTTAGGLLITGTSDGFVKAFDATRMVRSCGNSRPVPAWFLCLSPGKWTASSTSVSSPATAGRCRCGAVTWPT